MGSGMANRDHRRSDLLSIPAFARLVRGNTLVLKQQDLLLNRRAASAPATPPFWFNHILAGDGVIDRGLFHHAHWGIDYFGGQSVVSRPRRAAAHPGVGAMLNEARADMVMSPHGGALSGGGDFRDRAGV